MRKNPHRIAGFLVVFTTACFMSAIANADHIVIAADRWCPVNCEPNSETPGIMVEIARQVFSEAGHTVEYRVIPWGRAIREARQGNITGIVGAFVGDAPDFIFPENELMTVSGGAFFVPAESQWVYQDPSSLSDVVLGVILEYDYGETMNAYIEAHGNTEKVQTIFGDNPLERNIRKLLMGRIDVIIEASPVFWYTASRMGVKDKFRFAGQASGPEKCFIAFSPAVKKSKAYAEILSRGIYKLRQSGKLREILDRYDFE